jgi:DNA-binding transcriptional MerR regulator
MKKNDSFLTTGEAAKKLNRSVASIRLYERSGLLRAAMKTSNGVRIFLESDVEEFARTRAIKDARTPN